MIVSQAGANNDIVLTRHSVRQPAEETLVRRTHSGHDVVIDRSPLGNVSVGNPDRDPRSADAINDAIDRWVESSSGIVSTRLAGLVGIALNTHVPITLNDKELALLSDEIRQLIQGRRAGEVENGTPSSQSTDATDTGMSNHIATTRQVTDAIDGPTKETDDTGPDALEMVDPHPTLASNDTERQIKVEQDADIAETDVDLAGLKANNSFDEQLRALHFDPLRKSATLSYVPPDLNQFCGNVDKWLEQTEEKICDYLDKSSDTLSDQERNSIPFFVRMKYATINRSSVHQWLGNIASELKLAYLERRNFNLTKSSRALMNHQIIMDIYNNCKLKDK